MDATFEMECNNMSRFTISKSLFLIILSTTVTSCMWNDTDGNMPKQQQQQAAVAGPTIPTANAEKAAEPVRVAGGGPLGGYLEQFMDANDRSKMTRALDGGLGKASRWTNPVSGAQFAVTPVNKVSMGSNICRSYQVNMIKAGITDKVSGTA